MDKKNMPIGFFDSGVGGLSVLREAIKLMPNENYVYFGDSKNAPYGVKKVEEVKELTYKAVEFLLNKGAKAIVIACNTATSAAVASLRVTYPNMPIVGIEPAVKPAVEFRRKGPVIIMATQVTLSEAKFKRLVDRYRDDAEIVSMPCPKLVEFVESGNTDGDDLKEYLNVKLSDYIGKDIGAIVLGCTHYPFVKEIIQDIVGDEVPVIDGGFGTSKELKRQLTAMNLVNDSNEKGIIDIYNSLNEKHVELSKKLLYK